MEDTDWRPTPCPRCGTMREATRHPVCENKKCNYFGYRDYSSTKQMERAMKTEQRYVWIRCEGAPVIVFAKELETLFKDSRYDADNDKIFELGSEVKLKMQIAAIPTHPVKRNHTWENKE